MKNLLIISSIIICMQFTIIDIVYSQADHGGSHSGETHAPGNYQKEARKRMYQRLIDRKEEQIDEINERIKRFEREISNLEDLIMNTEGADDIVGTCEDTASCSVAALTIIKFKEQIREYNDKISELKAERNELEDEIEKLEGYIEDE